ncbi:hypothetical protein EDB19DRAFT_1834189 [Suillus lakei]|nr:hypothetical protein EDB19DRAFT_1834189 [Suillus lakei]
MAKRMEKWAVFTAIARAARLFAPKMYKTWLFNNKKKKERKDMIKYGRRWTPRMVIYQQKREEVLKRIEDESGAKPGGPTVKRVMAELSTNELEKAKETAKEWSNNLPPPEIQAQVASRKGPAYIYGALFEGDVEAMWDESGEVLFGMHDDNEALGDGDSFMKMKDWEDIEPVWQEYVQEQFGAGAWDGGQQVKGGHKRIRKPAFELAMDGDGMLLLPDITEMKLEEKKAVVRAFLTLHYHESIIATPENLLNAWIQVLADVDLKKPSKLQNWDTTALLNFWYGQQETGEGPTFLFKAWKNKDGDMVASVASENLLSHQTCKARMQIIQRPWHSSTEAKSDPKSDTHHMEDDADDAADTHEGTAVPHSILKPHPVKPKPKNMQGKEAVIEPLARTTQSKSMQKPLDSTPRVTRARGKK